MKLRVEIFANRSVQEDLFERLAKKNLATHYTFIPEIQGVGHSGPRRGDHVWPEENFALITYVDEEEAREIKAAVEDLREFFPSEGITFFAAPAVDL